MAETMMRALLNTLMGMGTVFLVLIFISLVISLFKYIPRLQARMENRRMRKREEARRKEPDRPAPKRPELPAEPEAEEEDLVYDGELVAVITAAILAYEGSPVSADRLVVRSIKRVRTKNRR